jgi:hypothetical protein
MTNAIIRLMKLKQDWVKSYSKNSNSGFKRYCAIVKVSKDIKIKVS